MSKLHELRTHPAHFRDVWSSRQTFELRRDDDFQMSDVLHLREYGDDTVTGELRYTSRSVLALVIHLLRGPVGGLAEGYVIMSLKLLTRLDGGLPCGMEGKK